VCAVYRPQTAKDCYFDEFKRLYEVRAHKPLQPLALPRASA
jgi:hypothetical protein